MSLRDKILAADDLERRTVAVPEWGEDVTVRGLTAGEVEQFGNEVNAGNLSNVMARLVSRVVINEDGTRVFTDEDVEGIAAKNSSVVKRLFDAAQEASGLGEDHSGN